MRKSRVHTTCSLPALILIWVLLLHSVSIWGQQSNTFYLLHRIPQSNLLNPAVQTGCKWYVGIPGLASSHTSYSNTAFNYNDLAGSNAWNIEGVFDQMHRVDLYTAEVYLHPISIGYRHSSLYFTFNITEKAHLFQTVPKQLAEIAIHGNGAAIGEVVRFNALRPGGYYNREYSIGVSKVLDQYWTVGVRAKLLFGKGNLQGDFSNLTFSTAESNFDLLMEGNFNLNGSLPVTVHQDPDGNIEDVTLNEINPLEMLLNRGNPGFGIDLGVIYRYDEKMTFSASLLDLGAVRWRTDLNNVNGTGTFIYDEVDPDIEVISFEFAEYLLDSLINSFDVELAKQPYFSSMPAQLYLGGSYQIKDNIMLGAVNRNVIFRNKLHSSLTFLGEFDLAKSFLATASWSYMNHSIKNIGAGIAYYGKGFQFHIVTENLLGMFYPFDTRTVNLRVGFNLMLGCPRNKKEKMQSEYSGRPPIGGDCSWTGKYNQRVKAKRNRKAGRLQSRKVGGK